MEQAIAVILFYCLSLIIKTNEFKFNILSIVKTSKKICTLTLVFFLGALTMVFSPANLSRASSVKNHSYEHIPTSILIFKIFQYSISIIWPILIIYIILFLIYTKSENKKHQKTNFKYLISENPYLIMSILSIAPFYLTGLKAAGERTLFLPFILGLIFILKLFNSIEVKRYLNFKSLVFLLIILLIDAIQASRSNYYYYKVGQQNLVELKKTGELKVYEKINALHRTTYLSDYNPLEPNSFWIKDCMNDYIKNK